MQLGSLAIGRRGEEPMVAAGAPGRIALAFCEVTLVRVPAYRDGP